MVHYRDTKGRDEAKVNLIPLINTHIYIYMMLFTYIIHFGTECSDFLGSHQKKTLSHRNILVQHQDPLKGWKQRPGNGP